MTKTKWTQGPLRANGIHVMRGNTVIAETFPTSLSDELGEEYANAKLFAVAPELVGFVEEWLRDFTAAGPTDSPREAQARALLAKINGE